MTVVLTMFILFTLVANHIGAEGNDSKISQIATGMENQKIHIDEWSLYSKKNVEKKTINEVKLLAKQYRHYNWKFVQDNKVYKAIGIFKNEKRNITEKLQILTTLTNDNSKSYILYEVKGMGMQKNWNKMNDYFKQQAFDIFHGDSTTFACVKGSIGDMMNISLYEKSNHLLKEFEASQIEQLREKNFLSISAKTTEWEDFIPTTNNEMNIQIALRTDGLGDKTTVVVGTPIITSEY